MPNTKRTIGVNPWWLRGTVNPNDCLAAFQPIGAASMEQSLQNLNGRGKNNAAIGTTPTFNRLTGWTFDGSTTYLTITGAIKSGVPLSMICLFYADDADTLFDLMHVSHSTADSGFKLQAAGATSGDPVRALSELATTEVSAATSRGFEATKWCVGAAVFSAVDARKAYIVSTASRNAANKNILAKNTVTADTIARDYADYGTETTSNTPVDLDGTYIGSAYSGAGTALANVLLGKIGACAFYGVALSGYQVYEISIAMLDLFKGDYR